MAVVILGIVIAPLSAAFMVTLRTREDTTNRLANSTDAQLLSIHLPPDVQNADEALTSGFNCPAASGTIKLQLRTTDTNFNVAYSVVEVPGTNGAPSTWQLVRTTCTGATAKASSPATSRGATGWSRPGFRPSGVFEGVKVDVTGAGTPNEPAGYEFTITTNRRTSA